MAPVPAARALLLPIIAALALSGCMQTVGPVAVSRSPSDLDSFAYGQRNRPAASGLASSPSQAYAATRAAYAAPLQVAHDAAYRLDAGDRRRAVVYGQEGHTNTRSLSPASSR